MADPVEKTKKLAAEVDRGRTARTPALALTGVTLFVAIAGQQWRLPGLYNDEAYDVVPAMQLVLGQPVELNRGVESGCDVRSGGAAHPGCRSTRSGIRTGSWGRTRACLRTGARGGPERADGSRLHRAKPDRRAISLRPTAAEGRDGLRALLSRQPRPAR